MKKWKAKWVVDEKFAGLQPGNLFSGQEPAGAAHREDLQNYHMLARKTFTLADKPRKVFLDISADDCYKLYINAFLRTRPALATLSLLLQSPD